MNFTSAIYVGRLYGYSKIGIDSILPAEPKPYAATIKLTENCNAKCITCNYWHTQWEDLITTNKAVNIIEQLHELGIKRLRFSGGEPLLRKDFFEVLDRIKDLHFNKITLATNGLLISRLHEKINRSCLTDLGVSIDGLPETNDTIRGVPGYFDRVMAGLKKITGKQITVMTTLTRYTHLEIRKLLELCEERGFLWDYNLLDQHIYFLQNTEADTLIPSTDEVDFLFDELHKLKHLRCMARISDIKLVYACQYLKGEIHKESPCYMAFLEVFIDSKGNILSGCNTLPPMGNIFQTDLKDVLVSERYQKRLRTMLDRKCPGCSCGYGINQIIEHLPAYALSQLREKRRVSPL